MASTIREVHVMDYLITNQELYTRIVDNIHDEHRFYNRRVNNTSVYRTIANTITRSENALVDRYIYQSPFSRPSVFDINNIFSNPIPSTSVSTPVSTLDISANVTFSEWPNYESVPVDICGNLVPIERCPISHQEFAEGNPIARINSCGHVFSERGLRRWLLRNNTCPMCRVQVDPSFNFLEVYGTNISIPANNIN
tara:strand:+ start:435 stop:1022 length:588 start_codon:yes stop_codon:yes gene_type:complete